jgi:hypothetical protein
VLCDQWFEDAPAELIQALQRASFIHPHKASVPDYIGGKNGGKPAFQILLPRERLTVQGH